MRRLKSKSPTEILVMRDCGKRLAHVTQALIPVIKPGMTTLAIDQLATKLLYEAGLDLSFPTVAGYQYAICTPVNNQAVHTEPSSYILKDGDVLTIDIGGLLSGLHTDWATTFIVGQDPDDHALERKEKFLHAGRSALAAVIKDLSVGKDLRCVGEMFETLIEDRYGYKILRDLTGHGVGYTLHEDPYIYNFRLPAKQSVFVPVPGFTCAIEIIYTETTRDIAQHDDVWTIDSADGSLAACFEETILFTTNGVEILTCI